MCFFMKQINKYFEVNRLLKFKYLLLMVFKDTSVQQLKVLLFFKASLLFVAKCKAFGPRNAMTQIVHTSSIVWNLTN